MVESGDLILLEANVIRFVPFYNGYIWCYSRSKREDVERILSEQMIWSMNSLWDNKQYGPHYRKTLHRLMNYEIRKVRVEAVQ